MFRKPTFPRYYLLRARPSGVVRPKGIAPRLLTRDMLEARRAQRRAVVATRTASDRTTEPVAAPGSNPLMTRPRG